MNKNRSISIHRFYGEDGSIAGASLKVYYKNVDDLSDSDVPRAWVDLNSEDVRWLVNALTQSKENHDRLVQTPKPVSED